MHDIFYRNIMHFLLYGYSVGKDMANASKKCAKK